jgi:hypothetical protein
MFRINKEKNIVESLEKSTFSALGFRERENLQEWICHNPEMFGENLLIIQKEFDGFNETRERLDLLALDEEGNLVIIENKLDDTGRDVVWQALKYASYCSTLTKSEIMRIFQEYLDKSQPGDKAEEILQDFFGSELKEIILNSGVSQRLFFVANDYRKEVTSTVLWLINNGLQIQCFKVTPYTFGDESFLNVEQIIPSPESKDFMISMADKEISEKSTKADARDLHNLRRSYWAICLEGFKNSNCRLFDGVSPVKDNWLNGGSGVSNVPYTLIFNLDEVRVQISISRKSKEENWFIFDYLHDRKEEIEAEFGQPFEWSKKEGQKSCYIKYGKNFDCRDQDNWTEIMEWHIRHMKKLENTMQKHLGSVNRKLKEG